MPNPTSYNTGEKKQVIYDPIRERANPPRRLYLSKTPTRVNYDYNSIIIKPILILKNKLTYLSDREKTQISKQTQTQHTTVLVNDITEDIHNAQPIDLIFQKLAILGGRSEFENVITQQINEIYEREVKTLFPNNQLSALSDDRIDSLLTIEVRNKLLNIWRSMHFRMIEYLSTVAKQEYGHDIGLNNVFNGYQINTMILGIIANKVLKEKTHIFVLFGFITDAR
ncbi:hypothetical protein AB837_00069 [bacterium AB1]|nr:hypothetical protein AB837_00069 [bacterium AB1]